MEDKRYNQTHNKINIKIFINSNKKLRNSYVKLITMWKKYQIKSWFDSIPVVLRKYLFNFQINYYVWDKDNFLVQNLDDGTIREGINKTKIIDVHQWLDELQGRRTLIHEIGHLIWQRMDKLERKKVTFKICKEIKKYSWVHDFIVSHYKKEFIFSKKYFEEYYAIKLSVDTLGIKKYINSLDKEIKIRKNHG